MKKLILLLTLIVAIGVNLKAQDYTGKIVPGESYKYINASTTMVNADSCVFVFDTQIHDGFSLDAGVNFDFVSGTQTSTVKVQGRKGTDVAWTTVGSASASSLTNTTTVVSSTSRLMYRQIKVAAITGGGTGTSTVDYGWLKLWNY